MWSMLLGTPFENRFGNHNVNNGGVTRVCKELNAFCTAAHTWITEEFCWHEWNDNGGWVKDFNILMIWEHQCNVKWELWCTIHSPAFPFFPQTSDLHSLLKKTLIQVKMALKRLRTSQNGHLQYYDSSAELSQWGRDFKTQLTTQVQWHWHIPGNNIVNFFIMTSLLILWADIRLGVERSLIK